MNSWLLGAGWNPTRRARSETPGYEESSSTAGYGAEGDDDIARSAWVRSDGGGFVSGLEHQQAVAGGKIRTFRWCDRFVQESQSSATRHREPYSKKVISRKSDAVRVGRLHEHLVRARKRHCDDDAKMKG